MMKLAYQTLLSSDFSTWPKKLREYLKKLTTFESKTGQMGYEFAYQKGPQQMQNFLHKEKVIFFVRLYHYKLLTTSVW